MDTGIPVEHVRPQEIKTKLCKKAKASKAEVQAACQDLFGKDDLDKLIGSLAKSLQEHPYDGLASVVACSDSETIRLAIRMSV